MSKFFLFLILSFCVLAAMFFGTFFLFIGMAKMMWFVTKWAAIVGWIVIAALVIYMSIRHFVRKVSK